MFNDAKETLRLEDTLDSVDLDPQLGNTNHMSHSPAFCSETGQIYSLLLTHTWPHTAAKGKEDERSQQGMRADKGRDGRMVKTKQHWKYGDFNELLIWPLSFLKNVSLD